MNHFQKIYIHFVFSLYLVLAPQSICQISSSGSELLGRPTNNSIILNVIPEVNIQAYVEYGITSGTYPHSTAIIDGIANDPLEIIMDNLTTDTRYYYRLRYRTGTSGPFSTRPEYTFHTRRALASTFTFTIIADSHLGGFGFCNNTLYTIACQNVSDDNPDLHFDLGDTFSLTGTSTGDSITVRTRYLAQRPFMGLFTHSTPLFLAVGNHEEEEGWNLDDAGSNYANSLPVMSTNARKRYYVNPIPDGFYTGNNDNTQLEIDDDHLHENYFAFQWGSALFVVLDPFWYTMIKPFAGSLGGEGYESVIGDRWDWTLGEAQYNWLKQTLEQSSAKYKFVLAHHVAGGGGYQADYGRGGEAATHDHEWGADTTDFAFNRPLWSFYESVHQLFLDNGVDIFFHGHDHVYAMEQVDGMIYQECPHPANSDYGYGFGAYTDNPPYTIVRPNSGHIRVTVSPLNVSVEYLRAFLPGDGTNGEIAHSYTIMNDNPLPVTLKNFTTRLLDGKVLLEWQTASEINNLGFNVYRAQSDSGSYLKISGYQHNPNLRGLGNSTIGKEYTYIDSKVENNKTYWYKISDVDYSGNEIFHQPLSVTVETVLVKNFAVFQNYPNPFNPKTSIRYSIPQAGKVTIVLYNILGQKVRTLFNYYQNAGHHTFDFNAGDLPSSVYFYQIEAGEFSQVKKMILMK